MTDKTKEITDMSLSELVDELNNHLLDVDEICCELMERIG